MARTVRIPGSPAICVVRFRSGGHEDALTQQVETCAAVHGPLDRLQSGDLSLNGAGTPRCGDGGDHGIDVALEAADKAVEQAPTGRDHPRVQGRTGVADIGTALA